MGIFSDIFRKKEKAQTPQEQLQQPTEDYEVNIGTTSEGRKVIEFYDNSPRSIDRFYDTTRLVIDKEPICLGNRTFSNCYVSWSGRDDTQYSDSAIERMSRRNCYEHIIVGIDMNLIEADPEYLKNLMRGLLNENRVKRYLETGLKTESQIQKEVEETGNKSIWACGMYVGDLAEKNGKYYKQFDKRAGEFFHNCPEMKQKREEYRENRKKDMEKRAEQLRRKASEIDKARDDI